MAAVVVVHDSTSTSHRQNTTSNDTTTFLFAEMTLRVFAKCLFDAASPVPTP